MHYIFLHRFFCWRTPWRLFYLCSLTGRTRLGRNTNCSYMYSWQNNLYMKFAKSLLNKQFLFPLKRKNTTWNVKPICPMLVAPSLGTSRSALLNENNNSIKWLIRQMMEERRKDLSSSINQHSMKFSKTVNSKSSIQNGNWSSDTWIWMDMIKFKKLRLLKSITCSGSQKKKKKKC